MTTEKKYKQEKLDNGFLSKVISMTTLGIVLTVAYITWICILRNGDFSRLSSMPLNELGDFLAGVFGPVAFLWLILGFIQQQRELQQNTRALMLQADELKKSVEQHKELVLANQDQAKIEREALEIQREEDRPKFIVADKMWRDTEEGYLISVELRNIGQIAFKTTVVMFDENGQEVDPDAAVQSNDFIETEDRISVYWETGYLLATLQLIIRYRSKSGEDLEQPIKLIMHDDEYEFEE